MRRPREALLFICRFTFGFIACLLKFSSRLVHGGEAAFASDVRKAVRVARQEGRRRDLPGEHTLSPRGTCGRGGGEGPRQREE